MNQSEIESRKHAKLKRLDELRNTYGMLLYKPYAKQREFHANGLTYRERLLMAGNKLGKTYSAGFETAFHLTGEYPDWWTGYRFTKQNRWWGGSVTSELTRDGMQRILMGTLGRLGSGCIPKDLIVDVKKARGVPDAIETVLIQHKCGEVSQLTFKAYSDGREAWQAEDLDGVWFDEEPPEDIYVEGVTRTNNTCGPVYLTFTPLLGMSNVVLRFPRPELGEQHPDRIITNMTIEDVEHYTPEQKRKIMESYPAHEREARAMGIPMLGSGRIYPIAESVIKEPTIPNIPSHWKRIIGLDIGWDHPTAAAMLVYDEAADCIHVCRAYRQSEATPVVHAAAIKPWGADWIPVAWPHDAYQHDKGGSCEQIAEQYRNQGLAMLSEHAKFPDKRGNGVEAGISEILERMQTGRFKVDENLTQWWEEYRMYHRKDGQVVKERDDLLCATRYGMMMLRHALTYEEKPMRPDRYALARSRHADDGTSWMSS
jgi:phage terminase large subunit-like protein